MSCIFWFNLFFQFEGGSNSPFYVFERRLCTFCWTWMCALSLSLSPSLSLAQSSVSVLCWRRRRRCRCCLRCLRRRCRRRCSGQKLCILLFVVVVVAALRTPKFHNTIKMKLKPITALLKTIKYHECSRTHFTHVILLRLRMIGNSG